MSGMLFSLERVEKIDVYAKHCGKIPHDGFAEMNHITAFRYTSQM